MVDLSDLLDDDEDVVLHPREIFLTLNRASDFQFPRDIQTEIMNAWFDKRNQKDTIIKLNVGGGKTLLGLLLLQSCINENVVPALYICPNNHLVSQVLAEADKLGIDVTREPKDIDFQAGRRICVTEVRRVFNGKSIFGIKPQGIRIPMGSVVIDDVHACLSMINEQFNITLQKTHKAYEKIFKLLEDALKEQAQARFLKLRDGDPWEVIEAPFWAWQDKKDGILEALHAEQTSDELKFSYPLLRDVLPLCRCFVSSQKLEIEPIFPPSDLIKSFAKAKRRIYMTATLSDDSVLTTHFTADVKDIESSIVPTSSQSMGERMILVPQDTNANLEFNDIQRLLRFLAKDHNVVVIVPSKKASQLWANHANQILTAENITEGINRLRKKHVGLTVLINRYDGIDLPGDACRVLAIFDLPEVTSFREAADHVALSTTDVALSRQMQRIEQGMGRGVRSNDDYCVVFLYGAKLTQRIKSFEGREMLTPATLAQMNLSERLTRKLVGATIEQLRDVARQCLNRDKTWIRVSKQVLLKIKSNEKLTLDAVAVAVRQAFDFARGDNFAAADLTLLDAINKAKDDDLKAWLMVRRAEIKNTVDQVEAQKILIAAKKKNSSVLRPIQGVAFQKLSPPTNEQAAHVQAVHSRRFITPTMGVLTAKSISEDLVFDPNLTKKFESALDDLGQLIGLNVQRPEKEMGEGPDNLWAFYDQHYFVIEVKSGATSEQGISKTDLGQLGQSVSWFKSNYPGAIGAIPVMVHPLQKPGPAATPVEEMRIITELRINMLKNAFVKFCTSLESENAINDVQHIAKLLVANNFTKDAFLNTYTVPPKL